MKILFETPSADAKSLQTQELLGKYGLGNKRSVEQLIEYTGKKTFRIYIFYCVFVIFIVFFVFEKF